LELRRLLLWAVTLSRKTPPPPRLHRAYQGPLGNVAHWQKANIAAVLNDVCFSNRPVVLKRFETLLHDGSMSFAISEPDS